MQDGGFNRCKECKHWLRITWFQSETAQAKYGFGEDSFKHRTQWVSLRVPSSRERTQRVPLTLLFVCKSELTEFFAKLTESTQKLSELSLPKRCSRNSIPLVPLGRKVAARKFPILSNSPIIRRLFKRDSELLRRSDSTTPVLRRVV